MFGIAESSVGSSNAMHTSDTSAVEVPVETPSVLPNAVAEGDSITHQERVQLVTALERNLAGVVPEATSRRDVLKNVIATLAGFTRLTRATVQGIAAAEAVNATVLAVDADNGVA